MDCHEGLPKVHSSSRGGHNASVFVGEGLSRQWNVPWGKKKKLLQFLLQLGFHLAFLLSKNKEIHQTDQDDIHLSTLHVLKKLYFRQLSHYCCFGYSNASCCSPLTWNWATTPPCCCQRPRLWHITACDPLTLQKASDSLYSSSLHCRWSGVKERQITKQDPPHRRKRGSPPRLFVTVVSMVIS